ncbi:MAG TPA: hypothetical protein VF585_10720 [Chthoniobacterales bacterium]|jgi:hypothetical protein
MGCEDSRDSGETGGKSFPHQAASVKVGVAAAKLRRKTELVLGIFNDPVPHSGASPRMTSAKGKRMKRRIISIHRQLPSFLGLFVLIGAAKMVCSAATAHAVSLTPDEGISTGIFIATSRLPEIAVWTLLALSVGGFAAYGWRQRQLERSNRRWKRRTSWWRLF